MTRACGNFTCTSVGVPYIILVPDGWNFHTFVLIHTVLRMHYASVILEHKYVSILSLCIKQIIERGAVLYRIIPYAYTTWYNTALPYGVK